MTQRNKRQAGYLAMLLIMIAVAASMWSFSRGWYAGIFDLHGFRQSQTALSIVTMSEGGPWLAYQTPLLGLPWSIPFEFPLYQWAACLLHTFTGIPIEQAARTVSVACFYLFCLASGRCLRELGLSRLERAACLVLLLASPLYRFWSRSVLIESCAAWLAMSFLYLAIAYLKRQKTSALSGAAIFASLAALTKITTFLPFFLVFALSLIASIKTIRQLKQSLWAWSLLGLLPIAAALAWTSYADQLKSASPLARGFLDSAALATWNFGTLAQRLDPQLWRFLLADQRMANILGAAPLFAVICLLTPFAGTLRRPAGVCLAAFISALLIFTNLHREHDYYQYANAVFAIAAAGLVGVGLLRQPRPSVRLLGYLLIIGVAASELAQYQDGYGPIQKANHRGRLKLAQYLDTHTRRDQVLVILGADWSSEIAYLSRRKALMNRWNYLPDQAPMATALADLAAAHLAIGAVVYCDARLQAEVISAWSKLTLRTEPGMDRIEDGCGVQLATTAPQASP